MVVSFSEICFGAGVSFGHLYLFKKWE